jgi:exopolyphosphatase/guanosine-5'-triphosphate,3'-diphosphate pyrophosphatase
MRFGVLDIGSNSAQLQVVDVRPGAPPLPARAVKEPTLLGEAFDADGSIDAAGVDRVVGAVDRAVRAARRLGAEQFTCSSRRRCVTRPTGN